MSERHLKNLIFALTLVFVTSINISAQSESVSTSQQAIKTDTIFNEIYLSEDGIAAVDSQGNDWYYDFKQDMFVTGLLERTALTRTTQEEIEPVETRCSVKKIVKTSTTKSIVIDVDEYVDHDIIVFGRVTVKGWVKGSITSYNNKVIVKSTGRVDGNINAPKIIVRDGGIVLGEQNEDLLEFSNLPSELPDNGFLVIMIIMAILCVFLFLIIALIPEKLQVVSNCFNRYKLRTTLLGLFFFFMMPLVIALVAITIIGIVVVPFVPLVYAFASVLGIAAFSHTIGSLVFGRFLSSGNRIFMKSFLGFALFAISWIMGITFMTGSENSAMYGIGIFFFVVSIIFSIVPIFGGIGAVVLTRFGTRSYTSWKDIITANPQTFTPAPPPMPKGPEIKTPPRHSDNS